MTKLDWRALALNDGVLREPTPDETRIILWLRGQRQNGYQHWDRIANVPAAEVAEEQGLCFTQATSLPARQKIKSLLGKLLDKFRKPAGTATWMLPSGGFAEQAGERQTGLLLVWGDEETGVPDETRLEARWGGGHHFRRVGRNLFVVAPALVGTKGSHATAGLLGKPREQAENLLAAARQAGDQRAEAAALTDLGIAFLRGGDSHRALVILEEAQALGRKLADKAVEHDAQVYLGMALLAVGQPGRAQELLGLALAWARETTDRFEEKIILANLGAVLAGMRDFKEALAATDHALILARDLGDRAHEADLLWFQAILQADLGRPDLACNLAQAAIDIHATLRSPHVGWLSSHLKKYRQGEVPAGQSTTPADRHPGGYYTGPTTAVAPTPIRDPGLLRTALSAVKTLADTSVSGMKTVNQATYQQRLETCAACPHHTGVRCKLSGGFTSAKAWFPFETCPIGKWKA